jgi:flagellar motor switch protein FliN/FliY
MDEEKQPSPGEDQELDPAKVPSEDQTAESSGSDADEKTDSSADLEMPDMNFAGSGETDSQAESAGESETGTASDDSIDDATGTQDAAEKDAEAAMLKMMEEGESASRIQTPGESLPDSGESQPVVEKAFFEPVKDEGKGEAKNLNLLLDVTLPIAIELGRTTMAIEDILNLGPGSVVELDKLAGEPVDLLVNNKLLARGEVVVIDENFGVRITSMISPQDRIRNLQ